MSTAEHEYARLPDGGLGTFGFLVTSSRLWLARDHLLQVKLAASSTETYQRFYFRDIQTLVLVKTGTWRILNWVLGLIAAGILLLAALAKFYEGGLALLIAGGLFAVIFLINLLSGPTCMVHLKTAVRQEELPSLRRQRRARKVLARLQPLIEEAQGAASREQLAVQLQSVMVELNLTGTASTLQPSVAPGYVPLVKPYRSRMHRWLYCLLLADTIISTANIFLPSTTIVVLDTIDQLAVLAAVIMALVRQDETDLKPALKSLTWVVTGYVALTYVAGYVVMVLMSASANARTASTQWAYIQALGAVKPLETPWMLALLAGTAAISLVLGLWGNLLLGKHWREVAKPPAAESAPDQPAPPPNL